MAISRRHFVVGSGLAAAPFGRFATATERSRTAHDDHVAFFVIGDTHYFADVANPTRLDPRSTAVTDRLIARMNELVGQEIPDHAGGGVVRKPFGMIHAGDVIDTGDKTGHLQTEMQRTEVAAFERSMGLTGRDGALDFPVYEVHGNHDGPGGTGHAIERFVERTKARPLLSHVSANRLHYSWDVGDVHFANLGIVVGSVPDIARRRRYDPRDSLGFLVKDLAEKVGDSGRPVILTHHVDIARYTEPVPDDAAFSGQEWDSADVGGFYRALSGYNVIAIFYGHTHARGIWRWNGVSVQPAGELPVGEPSNAGERPSFNIFNVDNSSHFASAQQALFYAEYSPDGLTVREYFTTDSWETGEWTPLAWRR